MDWLRLLREALDDAHDADHDEGCDCYERLCDGMDGIFRFPGTMHGPPLAPVYGCKTELEAMFDHMAGAFARVYSEVIMDSPILGLDAFLPKET